ncbi:long-chain fatty acid--CoA ligase [Nocardiopsis sp. EMB25]|uniref:long-chain-fatty-acid--CoA ligase n=1 Tax=Nocardiopsis TaxID=2013 RepID=UPI000347A32A|nr:MULTISPECIES: long-chain fatty acid--CoA ligase [Nocardiopsis]MCY9784068.1 long-chain fatty acid--CoA ligase [Nocardiopsis sp. EMB25]
MLNLAILLEDTARERPDRTALVHGDVRISYAELDAWANRVANALVASGVEPGDRVALSCPNLPYFPVAYYGVLKAGASVVPLNVLLTESEIAYHLRDSGAGVYLCFEGTPELPLGERGTAAFESVSSCERLVLITADPESVSHRAGVPSLAEFTAGHSRDRRPVATAETDTAVVLYTSGTTGRPKGAELTHSNLVHNALVGNRLFGEYADDVHLVALPLFHTFAQTVHMNAGLASGATLVLTDRFDPERALSLMEREGVTFFAGVPTMYWGLLRCETADRFDLARIATTMRISVSGGAALPMEVLHGFEDRFGVGILEGYGLSETSPLATFNRPDRPRRPGSVGVPVWGVEVGVVGADGGEAAVGEPGEIRVRGHNVMRGYLDRPEATAEAVDADGWFYTGDIGRRDADGYLYIVDRKKDMIIRGGYNVYPREIEEVLMTHPEVSLAAVVGVPHPSHGEEVRAHVVRAPGSALTEEGLIAWSRERLAGYKYPRSVEFADALPMTATGKILKRRLAAAPTLP